MSPLPKQVEEQAQMAEEAFNEMYSKSPQEEETPEEVPEAVEQQEEEEETYAKKYSTLKGKHDAEVPRLHNELKELKQMVFERLSPPKQEEVKQEDPYKDIVEKYKEEYGEDLLEMNKQLARMEFQRLFSEQMQPVQQQVNSVEETQVAAAQQNFMGYLDQAVKGDWKNLWSGKDEGFTQFLQQVEPNSRFKYSDIVKHHNDNWDADGLATVFNSYLESSKQKQARNVAKEAIVAPSRSTTHTTPKQDDARIWTQDSIAQFQREDRSGKYSSEDSLAMWNDLLAAATQGRIK